MAKLQNSPVVIRFSLGKGLYKARASWANTSRAIESNVGLTYADNEYERIRNTLLQRVEEDVRAELTHLAYQFRRFIIGAAGSMNSPSGTLDTVSKGVGAPTLTLRSSLPSWASRNPRYLERKREGTGGVAWFDNRGWLSTGRRDNRYSSKTMRTGGQYPRDPGLLFDEMRTDTWETMFGPISVRFLKNRNSSAIASQGLISTGTGTTYKIQVGTISVRALGKVDYSMLPGVTRSGGEVRPSTSGNPGLMSIVGAYDPRLAYRLGTMRNGIYRPTLEPFLAFFLTRALPHAVATRIAKGSMGSILR